MSRRKVFVERSLPLLAFAGFSHHSLAPPIREPLGSEPPQERRNVVADAAFEFTDRAISGGGVIADLIFIDGALRNVRSIPRTSVADRCVTE